MLECGGGVWTSKFRGSPTPQVIPGGPVITLGKTFQARVDHRPFLIPRRRQHGWMYYTYVCGEGERRQWRPEEKQVSLTCTMYLLSQREKSE